MMKSVRRVALVFAVLVVGAVLVVPVANARPKGPPAHANGPPAHKTAGPSCSAFERILGLPAESAIGALQNGACGPFSFYTVWDDGTDVIAREHPAVAGVPTPLDVDDEAGADLVGTIDFDRDAGELTVAIERAPDADGHLPVAVEALVPDPGTGAFERELVAYGYDQRRDTAPESFAGTLALGGAASAPELEAGFEQEPAGQMSSVVASNFDGEPAERTNARSIRVGYERSPGEADFAADMANSFQVSLATDVTGPVGVELEAGGAGSQLGARLLFDELPAEASLALGSDALSYEASEPADRVEAEVVAAGSSLPFAADHLDLRLLDLPASFELDLGEGAEELALAAGAPIGQIDLRARSAGREFPEIPAGEAGLVLDATESELALALRSFELELLDLALDPLALDSRMQGGRIFTVDAKVDAAEGPTHARALFDRLPAEAALTTKLAADEPIELELESSGDVDFLHLDATGLSGLGDVELTLHDVPTGLSICMDRGPACQRPNPNPIAAGGEHDGRPHPAEVSMDFDDGGSHGAGNGLAATTTLNAEIDLLDGDPLKIEDLRFRNLSFDFGQGPAFSDECTNGATTPRMYVFFDSRSEPWAMGSVVYPPLIRGWQIGTDGDPARAASRIAALVGCTEPLGEELDRQQDGGMDCGGQAVLNTRLDHLGIVDILDIPSIGAAVDVCGGFDP